MRALLVILLQAVGILFHLVSNGHASEFRMFTRLLTDAEGGQMSACVLTVGSNQFIFLPPAHWKIKGDAATQSVTLVAPDQASTIQFRLVSEDKSTNGHVTSDARRQELMGRYAHAKVIGETLCFAAGNEEIALDVARSVSEKLTLFTRATTVNFPGQRIEASMTSAPQKFSSILPVFNNVLVSLRMELQKRKT